MGTYRTKQEIKRKETQEHVLLSAMKLFLAKGYTDVTVVDLEQESGLSRGAIYYELKSKQELFRAVIDKYVFRFLGLYTHYTPDEKKPFLSFLENECDTISMRMELLDEVLLSEGHSPNFFGVLLSAKNYYEGFSEKLMKLSEIEVKRWEDAVKEGIKAGELREDIDPATLVKVFRCIYHGLSFFDVLVKSLEVDSIKSAWLYLYDNFKVKE